MITGILFFLGAVFGLIAGWLIRDRDDRHRSDCPCGHHPVMHGRGGINSRCMAKACPCQVDYHEALRLAGLPNPHKDIGHG